MSAGAQGQRLDIPPTLCGLSQKWFTHLQGDRSASVIAIIVLKRVEAPVSPRLTHPETKLGVPKAA